MRLLRNLVLLVALFSVVGCTSRGGSGRGGSDDDDATDDDKIICLLHMKALLRFFAFKFPMRKKTAAEIAEFSGTAPAVARRILAEFADVKGAGTEDVSFSRTREQKDRLLMFVLAHALFVHNCCVRHGVGAAIAGELKLTAQKLGRYLKELGCRVERVKAEDMKQEHGAGGGSQPGKPKGKSVAAYDARLLCPLTFPTNTRGN